MTGTAYRPDPRIDRARPGLFSRFPSEETVCIVAILCVVGAIAWAVWP